jgi:hypothetical protein
MAYQGNVKKAADVVDDWMETLKSEPTYKIIIHKQEGHEGTDDVKLPINGNVLLIKRGYEVEIGESYLKNLQSCQYDIFTKDDHGNDFVAQVPRFSFSIISGPHQRKAPDAPEQPVAGQVQAG